MITGMLFNMYVSVGENECLLDTQWEYPQEDPLSDTGFEEVEDQVIGSGFHFYGLHRLPYLKKYTMDVDDEIEGMKGGPKTMAMFNDHRILLMNITRNYKTSDEKIRQYTFRAKLHVPCPLKLHRDALGSTIDKAFENQIDDLEESFESLPPKTDVWQTMSTLVFDRELSNLLSTETNDHLKFYFSNYGLNLLFLDLRVVSTV